MATAIQSNFRIRKNLGRIQRVIEVPNLIDIQKSLVRQVPAVDVPQNDASGDRAPGRLPQRLPDQGLQRHE